jgi:hypothetical protein
MLILCTLVPLHHAWLVLPSFSCSMLPPSLPGVDCLSSSLLGGPGPPSPPSPELTPFPSGPRQCPTLVWDTHISMYVHVHVHIHVHVYVSVYNHVYFHVKDHVPWTWTLTWTWTGTSTLLSWIFWHAHRHGHSQWHEHADFNMPRAICIKTELSDIVVTCVTMESIHPCIIVHKGIRQFSDRGQNWVWHSRSSCHRP